MEDEKPQPEVLNYSAEPKPLRFRCASIAMAVAVTPALLAILLSVGLGLVSSRIAAFAADLCGLGGLGGIILGVIAVLRPRENRDLALAAIVAGLFATILCSTLQPG